MRRLILIGGSAGTGKTSTARHLAAALGAGWLQLDTIWIALRAATEPGSVQHEVLDINGRLRREGDNDPSVLDAQVEAAEAVCRVLPAVFAFELESHPVLVADGAWLLPSFIDQLTLDNADVRAVFLHHDNSAGVEAALAPRLGGRLPEERHRRTALAIWRYGNWVTSQASTHGLAVIDAAPFETLPARAQAAIGVV
jgi:2-phosphoglycerate kinase